MTTTFADVLPVKQVDSHKYSVSFEDHWCIGTGEDFELLYTLTETVQSPTEVT